MQMLIASNQHHQYHETLPTPTNTASVGFDTVQTFWLGRARNTATGFCSGPILTGGIEVLPAHLLDDNLPCMFFNSKNISSSSNIKSLDLLTD